MYHPWLAARCAVAATMKRRQTPAGRPESDGDGPELVDPEDAFESDADAGGVRLNKFLAQNGITSRRGADVLIAKGQVQVDGRIVTELGTRIDPLRSRVEVGGVVLQPQGERPRYYLLNKPCGVVCTNDPREARPRAIDLIRDKQRGRIYTVGRLDEDTEGLVILTNDGEFANRISHPRYGVQKTYWVDVRGRVSDEQLEAMRKGVRLSEGWAGFEHVLVRRRHDERSILQVTLGEGKNREVRRVLAALGLPVRTLRRIAIGELSDRRLKTGQWRPLSRAEVGSLLASTGASGGEGAPKELRPVRRRRFQNQRPGTRRPWSDRRPRYGNEPEAGRKGKGGARSTQTRGSQRRSRRP